MELKIVSLPEISYNPRLSEQLMQSFLLRGGRPRPPERNNGH